MLLKNTKLTLIKIAKREGVKKDNQQPYLFYVGNFIDEEANICNLKIGVSLEPQIEKLLKLQNVPVTADIALYPSGFKLNGTVVRIEE